MSNSMRGLLERALHEAGLSAPIKKQLPKQIWEAVVGKEIASRAQPTVLQCGTLHVLVQDHRWRDQLDAMRTELKARLNAKLGKMVVREIRFGLAHAGALPARARVTPPPGAQLGGAVRAIAVEGEQPGELGLPAHLKFAQHLGPDLREAFLRARSAAARSGLEASA